MSGAPTDHKTAPVGIESLCLLQEAGSTGQFEGLFASSEGPAGASMSGAVTTGGPTNSVHG